MAKAPAHGEQTFAGDAAELAARVAAAGRVYVDGGDVIRQFFAIVLGGGIRLFTGGEGKQRLEGEFCSVLFCSALLCVPHNFCCHGL